MFLKEQLLHTKVKVEEQHIFNMLTKQILHVKVKVKEETKAITLNVFVTPNMII